MRGHFTNVGNAVMNGKMGYNWQSAATPQGRERLKKLMDLGVKVPCRDASSIRADEHRYLFPELRMEHFDGNKPRVYYRFGFPYDVYEDRFVDDAPDWLTRVEFLDPEPPAPVVDEKPLDFGAYCCIEQFRYAPTNEFYQYKVIGRLRSNTWVDVPVKHTPIETRHDGMEDVVLCICCGIDETKVHRFRVSDVVPHGNYSALNRALQPKGGGGV